MKSNSFKQINFRNMINKHDMCYIIMLLHLCINKMEKKEKKFKTYMKIVSTF